MIIRNLINLIKHNRGTIVVVGFCAITACGPAPELLANEQVLNGETIADENTQPQQPPEETTQSKKEYQAKATAYYPSNDGVEGGFKDRKGNNLHPLQKFLAGEAPYVSVAMDTHAFPYGTKLRIPEFEKHYGKPIEFRVVDTGGAFKGKGTSRIDICVESKKDIYHPLVNGTLTLIPAR
ncbi:MAG: hypothetical protein RJB66_1986 [Pseudomonadota bacterium]